MTRDQIEQAFEACVGMPPRIADVLVIEMMGESAEALAEYVWDHWFGEPDEPTYEQVLAFVKKFEQETK